MGSRFGIHVILLAAGCFPALPAHAQRDVTLLRVQSPFYEEFRGEGPRFSSGNFLLGLRLGDPSPTFSPEALRVALRSPPRTGRLCLGVASRDGGYTAEALYAVGARVSGLAGFEFPSAHLDMLSRYAGQQVAVLVRDTGDCNATEFGTVLPAMDAPLERGTVLHAYINAPAERSAISLGSVGGRPPLAGTCRPDPGVSSVAFQSICSVTLPEALAAGTYQLHVTVREGLRPRTVDFAVRFDPP